MTSDTSLNNSLRELRKEAYDDLRGQFWRLLTVYAVMLLIGSLITLPLWGLAALIAVCFAVYDYFFTDMEQSWLTPIHTYVFVLAIVYAYEYLGGYGLIGIIGVSVVLAGYIVWMRWERYKYILRSVEQQLFGQPLIDNKNSNDEEEDV